MGSNPMHTIYASMGKFCLYLSLCWDKGENKDKRGLVWPILSKTTWVISLCLPRYQQHTIDIKVNWRLWEENWQPSLPRNHSYPLSLLGIPLSLSISFSHSISHSSSSVLLSLSLSLSLSFSHSLYLSFDLLLSLSSLTHTSSSLLHSLTHSFASLSLSHSTSLLLIPLVLYYSLSLTQILVLSPSLSHLFSIFAKGWT